MAIFLSDSCHPSRLFVALAAMLGVYTGLVAPARSAPPVAGPRIEQAIALNGADSLQCEFMVGPKGKIELDFTFAGAKPQIIFGTIRPDTQHRTVLKDGKKTPETTEMPDGLIEFRGPKLNFSLHARPNLVRYTEAQQEDLAKKWDTLIPASQHWTAFEVRADRAGAELWLEGRYCGRLASESALTEVKFKLEQGGEVRNTKTFTRTKTGQFLSLDVRNIAKPGVMHRATLSLKPGMQDINSVPMNVAYAALSGDVSMAKEMQGSRFLETNEYTSRTSLDGMPESLHFSVPQEFYHRAWVLCAVDPDPAKDPVLTTRLTRFGVSGRGGAMADTTITLPRGDEKPGPGITPVGTVETIDAKGAIINPRLYLVRVDLKIGDILDLIADVADPYQAMKIGPYLDFEFLGKCGGIQVQHDRRREPIVESISGVHIYGVTLEKSPVEMRLKQSQPGNIFHNDETPETTFALRANVAGRYTLHWTIGDVTGKTVAGKEKEVDLAAPGEEKDATISLPMPDVGWYSLHVTLLDASGDTLLKHDAAFALLGRDTRTAGYESPFGTWWFNGVHYSTKENNIAGPLLFKAGLRRTTFGWTKDGEAELAPWKLSLNQISWPFRLADLKDWPAAEARAEKSINAMLKRFPHCQYIDLFHESYDPGAYPPELYGQKYEPKPEQAERDAQLLELGLKAAKFFRAKFPQLKIVAGNAGGSAGMVAVLLRGGFPRDLIDYIGSETTGQTFAPDKLTPHTTGGIFLLGQTARTFGYDIPMAGCFEFTSRAERDLGAQRLAEWNTRDVLMALGNRFPTISPVGLEDVGNSYYDMLYGASGLCERSPLHYPKPTYVALATLTKTLDTVKLVRQMPTGSSSAYALEFERGSQRIYAIWTAHGQCEFEFAFPEDAELTHVEFYGKQHALRANKKTLMLTGSSAAQYIVSPIAATSVTAGRRAFPQDQPPADTRVLSHMDDVSAWQLADEPTLTTPLQIPGHFKVSQVNDPEKGACLELVLQHEGKAPAAVVGEYAALRLKQPIPISGQPHSVGIWVNGDSSFGRIIWELEDATGHRWRSTGGYDGGDWCNRSAINFDGWCFVGFPLTNASPYTEIEPGPGIGQWFHPGVSKLEFPIKLIGVDVVTYRQSVNLTQLEPVKRTIRIKDVSVIGNN